MLVVCVWCVRGVCVRCVRGARGVRVVCEVGYVCVRCVRGARGVCVRCVRGARGVRWCTVTCDVWNVFGPSWITALS